MASLSSDPIETVKLCRELDFVITTIQEGKGFGCGSLERPRGRAEDMCGIQEGPYFAITVEVGDRTLSSARVTNFDRPEGDVNGNSQATSGEFTYTIAT